MSSTRKSTEPVHDVGHPYIEFYGEDGGDTLTLCVVSGDREKPYPVTKWTADTGDFWLYEDIVVSYDDLIFELVLPHRQKIKAFRKCGKPPIEIMGLTTFTEELLHYLNARQVKYLKETGGAEKLSVEAVMQAYRLCVPESRISRRSHLIGLGGRNKQVAYN